MRFLRRSIMGAVASAVATWTWQNRGKLTKSGRTEKGPKARDAAGDAPGGPTTSGSRGLDHRVSADAGSASD